MTNEVENCPCTIIAFGIDESIHTTYNCASCGKKFNMSDIKWDDFEYDISYNAAVRQPDGRPRPYLVEDAIDDGVKVNVVASS